MAAEMTSSPARARVKKSSPETSRSVSYTHLTGVLGIIGPRHLDYTRIIPHLAYFTDLLGRILNGTDGDG